MLSRRFPRSVFRSGVHPVWMTPALDICDQVILHSMSPTDFQSVSQVIEAVAPGEIYNLSGQSSVSPVLYPACKDIGRDSPRYAPYAQNAAD